MAKDNNDEKLKKLAEDIHYYNEKTRKRTDIDQATKDRIITANMESYEEARERYGK